MNSKKFYNEKKQTISLIFSYGTSKVVEFLFTHDLRSYFYLDNFITERFSSMSQHCCRSRTFLLIWNGLSWRSIKRRGVLQLVSHGCATTNLVIGTFEIVTAKLPMKSKELLLVIAYFSTDLRFLRWNKFLHDYILFDVPPQNDWVAVKNLTHCRQTQCVKTHIRQFSDENHTDLRWTLSS